MGIIMPILGILKPPVQMADTAFRSGSGALIRESEPLADFYELGLLEDGAVPDVMRE